MRSTTATQSTDITQATQSAFVSLHIITASCHAVQNTVFIAPTPKPTWFDDLNAKLDAAKANAAEWINDLATEVTATIPSKVIDYGTTYDAVTQQILEIAAKHPDAKGQDDPYVKEVAELVDVLLDSVGSMVADVDSVADKLESWGVKMQQSHNDLTEGSANIQNAEISLQTDIKQMSAAIDTLNSMIAEENKQIAMAAIAVGGGLFLLVVGIALAPVSGGASLIVGGIGVAAIVGGAITWGVIQAKVNDQFKQIAEDQQKIADDQRQLVALTGLSQASDMAIRSIDQATQALSDFRTSWGVFSNELKGVKSKLQSAEQAISVIIQETFTNAAQNEWKLAVQTAQDLAEAKVQVQAQTVPMAPAA